MTSGRANTRSAALVALAVVVLLASAGVAAAAPSLGRLTPAAGADTRSPRRRRSNGRRFGPFGYKWLVKESRCLAGLG